MNFAVAMSLLAFMVGLSSSATAQEKSPPEEAGQERLAVGSDGGCVNLRMPGIAETASQYDAYLSEYCQAEQLGAVEAASVIHDVGAVYRAFVDSYSRIVHEPPEFR